MDFSKEIDFSSLSDYILCPRKFFFSHVLCLSPTGIPNLDLIFGGAWHYALEKAYGQLKENPDAPTLDLTHTASQAFQKFWDVESNGWFDPDASFPKSPGRAKDMLYEYFNRFSDQDRQGKVLAIEAPFTIHLGPGLPAYIGRRDLDMDFDGWLYTYEHKTAKYVNDVTTAGFDNSLQGEGYLASGHLYYDKMPRIIFNIALCQKTKIDFTRHQVTRREAAIDRFLYEVGAYARKINEELQEYYRLVTSGYLEARETILPVFLRANASTACTNYFRKCPYFDLCLMRNNPASHWRHEPPQGYEFFEWNPRTHEEEIRAKLDGD